MRLVGVLVLVSAGMGCRPHDLDWTLQFDDERDGRLVLGTEVSIVRGDCESEDIVHVAPLEDGVEPPVLPAGTYGFRARARDVRCNWFLAGCTAVKLPRDADDDDVLVTLGRVAPEPACEGSCIDGQCGPPGGVSCPAGWADCNGDPADGCEADLATLRTCGSCAPCDATFEDHCYRLLTGVHVCTDFCTDDFGEMSCGEACSDLANDPRNCNGCGLQCPDRPNADPVCIEGACGYECRVGFFDCDLEAESGCETRQVCSP